MNNILERKQITSYRLAALFHEWGIVPRVRGINQIGFSYCGYDFTCFIKEQTILLHYTDVIFNEERTYISEIQAELSAINKRINSSFGCFSAFYTENYIVELEITHEIPICPMVVTEHLFFVLKEFLACSIDGINLLKDVDYITQAYKSSESKVTPNIDKMPSVHSSPQLTNLPKKESIPKKERCFSCEGEGYHSCGTACSICDGHGVSREIMVKKKRDNMPANESIPKAKRCHVCKGNGKDWDGSVCYYCQGSGIDFQFHVQSTRKTNADYDEDDIGDYGDSIGWSEGNSMQDDDLSDYTAEMGHDGDDY